MVVAPHHGEQNNGQGNEEQRNPGAFHEFRDQNHNCRDTRHERAQPVDQCALQPMRTAVFPPVYDHAGLRKREGQKSSNGIERDKPVSNAAKKNQHPATKQRQQNDAVGIDETPPAVTEDVRQIIVLRDGAAETGKVGKGGVSGQGENDENGADGQIVKEPFAEDRGGKHGENTLIPGLAWVRRSNSIHFHEIGDPRQQNSQEKDDHRQRTLSVFDRGLAESLHSIADGFHSSQCRATAGEDLEQQPVAHGFDYRRRSRKRYRGRRVPSADEDSDNARDDGNKKRADKHVGGDCESTSGLAHPAKIKNRDDNQNANTKRDHVRQQRGHRRDQSAHSGGNTDRSGKNVIGQQRGRSQQARRRTKIEPRYGIGTAALGIRRDGLAIREVHDQEQRDDGRADGNDIADAKQAKRNQKTESRFRAIRSRAKPIQTKDRYTLHRADLLSSLIAGSDRLSDNEIKDVHKRFGQLAPEKLGPRKIRAKR